MSKASFRRFSNENVCASALPLSRYCSIFNLRLLRLFIIIANEKERKPFNLTYSKGQ